MQVDRPIEKPSAAPRAPDGFAPSGIPDGSLGPCAILEHPRLTRDEKVLLLRDLAYDACERAVAEEEGMCGGVASDAYSVMWALNELTRGFDVEHTSPTKHAAFAVR